MKKVLTKDWRWIAAMAGLLLVLLAACVPPQSNGEQDAAASEPVATPPADPWSRLLAAQPHPYLLSQPAAKDSLLDGTYVKVEPERGERVPCKRCPDYAREAGTWKLNLAAGTFRVFHVETGWRSLGSFIVTQDRISKVEDPNKLLLFNDPYCPDIVGVYRWELEGGNLNLEPVDDTCSYRLRAANLGTRPWLACAPPNQEAAITDHWPKPAGCD